MRSAKLFSIAIFAAMLSYGAIGFIFLPLAAFEGDLTRLGQLPESLFGWRKPQPAIEKQWLTQASMQDADVLVIGDSFSLDRIWQSVLTQGGLKVRTEAWANFDALCSDLIPLIHSQGFRGRYLVVEVIERNLASVLAKSVACEHTKYRSKIRSSGEQGPMRTTFDRERADYSGKMSIGLRTWLNILNYERISSNSAFKTLDLPNNVRLVRLENGCDLFSHQRCSDVLFLKRDQAGELDSSVLANMATINSRMRDLHIIWAVIPNKSTAYLYPDKKYWNEAESRFNAPNLLRSIREAIDQKTIDVYPGNNTHFSATGYLLAGQEIQRAIAQTR